MDSYQKFITLFGIVTLMTAVLSPHPVVVGLPARIRVHQPDTIPSSTDRPVPATSLLADGSIYPADNNSGDNKINDYFTPKTHTAQPNLNSGFPWLKSSHHLVDQSYPSSPMTDSGSESGYDSDNS
ncbi:hypothetical protein BJ085DRAFT_39270, partial [Dimargaris cristalligena]